MSALGRWVKVDIPFQSMGRAGWHDDVDRELTELAEFYYEDYAAAVGKRHSLTAEDFYRQVVVSHDARATHLRLAQEMVAAFDNAAGKLLLLDLGLEFQALRRSRQQNEWWILAPGSGICDCPNDG